jgi:hypothetical protein
MIENSVKDSFKKYGGVYKSVFSEIENKFFWIKVKAGVKSDFGWLFSKLDNFIEKIFEWISKMIKNDQIPKEIEVEV